MGAVNALCDILELPQRLRGDVASIVALSADVIKVRRTLRSGFLRFPCRNRMTASFFGCCVGVFYLIL